jgi:hypothetical protein
MSSCHRCHHGRQVQQVHHDGQDQQVLNSSYVRKTAVIMIDMILMMFHAESPLRFKKLLVIDLTFQDWAVVQAMVLQTCSDLPN